MEYLFRQVLHLYFRIEFVFLLHLYILVSIDLLLQGCFEVSCDFTSPLVFRIRKVIVNIFFCNYTEYIVTCIWDAVEKILNKSLKYSVNYFLFILDLMLSWLFICAWMWGLSLKQEIRWKQVEAYALSFLLWFYICTFYTLIILI